MKYSKQLKKMQDAINKQASENGGWINLETRDGEVVAIVAKQPFYRWAMRGTGINIYDMYPWENISPIGMKMMNDDSDHSDWMIGAGLDIGDGYMNNDYENPKSISRIAYRLRHKIQDEELNFECMVLCNGGRVTGRIKHVLSHEKYLEEKEPYKNPNYSSSNPNMVLDGDIIVIPHAGVDFEQAFLDATKSGAGGVITVIPNKVAHLCKIARERNVTIMCDPDAFTKYKDTWCTVTLVPDKGNIKIKDDSWW